MRDDGRRDASPFDVPAAVDAEVHRLAVAQHGVVSGEQLVRCGVPETTVLVRARPGGPYVRVLPGVFAVGSGGTGAAGRLQAARLYAGSPDAVLTGLAALHCYGFAAVDRVVAVPGVDARLHVLVPHAWRRESHGFVRVERTRYLPEPVLHRGLQLAPVARAIADAGRTLGRVDLARPLVHEALRRRLVTGCELAELVATMPMRGSIAVRQVVDEVWLGVGDPAVRVLRDAIVDAGLPLPLFMPTIHDRRGALLSRVHAFRAPEGIAFVLSDRVDLLEGADAARPEELRRTGVLVLAVDTGSLAADPSALLRTYRRALQDARDRPAPAVRVVRAPGGVSGRHGAGAG